jgi:VWFA-related protein
MNLRTALVLAIASLVLASVLVSAQQPASESETLSSTTELVLVPAQVKGHDGKPLLGLKQEDFVVRSDGKPQPIRVFEQMTQTPATAANQPAAPVPPNIVLNVPNQGMPDQILIIAIDLVNTAYLDQTRAKQQLIKYLSAQSPQQHFALVAITKDGLQQIHNFSSDPAVLLEALKRVESTTDKDIADQQTLLDTAVTAAEFSSQLTSTDEYTSMMSAFKNEQIYGAYAQKIAARATLTALMQIAQAYAGVPGRKSVIWLTGGMPILVYNPVAGGAKGNSALNADTDLLDDYDQAWTALNNSNVAIYGINLKGISTNRTYQGSGMQAAMHNPIYQTRANSGMVSPFSENDEAIQLLSDATGGKPCTANLDLKDCIDQAVADSASYYMLGFYVPQQERKAGRHKLEVKLTSERGTVRSRSSYYLAPTTAPSDKEIARELRDATNAKIGYTGIAFAVQTKAGDAAKPAMRIIVPARSVLLSPGHPQLSYDIVSVPLNAKGEPAADLRIVHLNLTEEQTQNALSKGWSFTDQPQGTGSKAIKYILRDNGTGRIGSVIVPLQQKAGG